MSRFLDTLGESKVWGPVYLVAAVLLGVVYVLAAVLLGVVYVLAAVWAVGRAAMRPCWRW